MDVNKFLFLNLGTVLQNSTAEKFANICQIARDGIKAKMFESARIHLCDVFAAIAVVDA